MAAAEYFNPGGLNSKPPLSSSPQHSPAPAQAHPSQQHLNPPYPISDAPPPYEEISLSNNHTSLPRPSSSSNQYRPSSTSQYPDDKPPAPPRPPGRPISSNSNARFSRDSTAYSTSAPYPAQPLPPTSHPTHLRPDYNPNFPNASTATLDAYSRRPTSTPPKLHGILKNKHESTPYYEPSSRSRSRSSSRERRSRRHRHSRHQSSSHQRYDSHHADYPPSSTSNPSSNQQLASQQQQKKGNSVKTFLGAGGGALIGDCIFPGLGTIGGAILGGLGGHEYGKREKGSSGQSARGMERERDGRGERGDRMERTRGEMRGEMRPRSYSNNDEDYYYDRERRRGRGKY